MAGVLKGGIAEVNASLKCAPYLSIPLGMTATVGLRVAPDPGTRR